MQADPSDLWKRSPIRHPSILVPERPDLPLWRYMTGARFRWLVEQRRLYMPRIDQMLANDPREGTITNAHAEFWKELIDKADSPELAKQYRENFERFTGFVNMFRQGWFINCWHQSPSENFAFWRIYGRGESACPSCKRIIMASSESVAVTTTFSKLEALLPAHIDVGTVRYLDFRTEGGNLYNMFDYVFHKRHFYKYESEVRAVASMRMAIMPGPARDHILTNQVEGSYAPPIDPKALIDEVVIHPEAEQSFREDIAAICEHHGLPLPRLSGLAS